MVPKKGKGQIKTPKGENNERTERRKDQLSVLVGEKGEGVGKMGPPYRFKKHTKHAVGAPKRTSGKPGKRKKKQQGDHQKGRGKG